MFRFCAVAAMLLALATQSANAAEPPEENAATPWYKRIFSSPKPKPAPATDAPVEKSPTWTEVSRSLDQERAVYMERLQFCTRLRQIAVESGDEELQQKASQLEDQAEEVYMKRTRKLPSIVQDVKAAEAALEQKSTPPKGTASTNRVSQGRAPNGRPIVTRE